jgi:peptidoglycan/LPS O-acetylase OafA/YrhL
LPDTYTTLSPLPAVTWSLSIEEQIYIFFPFIALLLARKKIVTLSIVLPTLMFGIFFVQINVFNSTTASRLTPLYLIPVIIGLVCAEFENIIRWKNSRISVIIIELTIGLVVILTIIFSHSQSNISYYLRVILMSCIFPLLLHLISFTRMWVALKAIAYLGRVSFGCYLYHWLVWNIFQSLDIGYSVGSGFTIFGWLLGLFVTLVLSVISYRFLEAPFLDIRRRYQAAPTS